VVWLQYADKAFAFCSDVGSDTLQTLCQSYELCKELGQDFCTIGKYSVNLEDCNVLSVAGHGSNKCTYSGWYDLLSPQQAVLSVGKNYSDCPSVKSLADVTNCGAQVISTAESGNITIKVVASSQTTGG
jgi:hypothetical protein